MSAEPNVTSERATISTTADAGRPAVGLTGLSREQLVEMYRLMWAIRHFDSQVIKLFMEGLIRGSTHAYIGMEAVAVGACAALRADDYITSTHRGHGHCI